MDSDFGDYVKIAPMLFRASEARTESGIFDKFWIPALMTLLLITTQSLGRNDQNGISTIFYVSINLNSLQSGMGLEIISSG
jgi:hypothetical protein